MGKTVIKEKNFKNIINRAYTYFFGALVISALSSSGGFGNILALM